MTRFQMSDKTWWRIIGVAFGFLVFLNAFGDGLGRLEGIIWPVKNNAVLSNLREKESGAVAFDGSATKRRDCELDSIRWFYVSPRTGNIRELDLVMRDRPQHQAPGEFRFRNWELYVSPSDLLRNTRAYAWHTCHPFFKTITVFFDPGDDDGNRNAAISGPMERRPAPLAGAQSLHRPD